VNAIKNGWEETDGAPHSAAPTSALDERLTEQVKIVLEHTCSILSKATATDWNLSSKCLLYSHKEPGEMKSLCKVDST
jgi:hypothetical protein